MANHGDKKLAESFAQAWREAVAHNVTFGAFAGQLGMSQTNLAKRRRTAEKMLGIELDSFASTPLTKARKACAERLQRFSVTSPRPTAEDEIPIEELIANRVKHTRLRLSNERLRELVEISLDVHGPFGIAMIGDPHLDNPGCNLELLIQHTELIAHTDGMFAVCVGDIQDNWVGRLARLWAGQGIAARDSQRLADWWFGQFNGKLLAVCEGNHDAWAVGNNQLSPIAWIESRLGAVVERDGVRLRLTSHDDETVTINMRHDFPGRSQYNAAHGPNKSLLFGCRDDVAVAGHTHEFGIGVRLDPETRKPMHAVRLGSYKHSDDYARQMGLLDNNVSECAVLMVDPSETDPRHRTWVETCPFRAARILTWMREQWLTKTKAQKTGHSRKMARCSSIGRAA